MSTQEIHKYGTDDGWHGIIQEGGDFPPEKGRYHLYIGKPTQNHITILKQHSHQRIT